MFSGPSRPMTGGRADVVERLSTRGAAVWRRPIVPQADAAQRRGDWADAVRLYEMALARHPARPEVLIQLGHCHKQLRAFRRAYECYSRANALRATGDGCLQLGHLLRMTGNLYGSLRAYEAAARLGEAAATACLDEIAALTRASLGSLLAQAQVPDGTIRLALAWCEHDFGDVERLRAAAHLLLDAGLARSARGFFELSFVRDGFSPDARTRQVAIALQTGLWQEGGPLAMPTGGAPGMAGEALRRLWGRLGEADTVAEDRRETEAFLREETRLFAGAIAAPGEAHAARRVSAEFATGPAADPVALIGEVYRALAAAIDDPSAGARLKDLAKTVLTAPAVVSFGEDPAADAARVLYNGLQYFLWEHRQPIAGPFASPDLLAMLWRLDAAAPAQASDSPNQVLLHLILASRGDDDRRALERLLTLVRHRLPFAGLEECAETASEAGLARVTGLLLDRIAAQPGRRTPEFLLWASGLLKRNGELALALDLARRAAALWPGPDTLNELAILEKACGHFERAIAVLERRLAEAPEDELVLRELLAILPEQESIPGILSRFTGSPMAREIAAERLLYRLQLEPGAVDNGSARFAAGAALQQLAPELAPQLVDTSEPQALRESIETLQLGREYRNTASGLLPVLRGIEAIRVRTLTPVPLLALRLRLDGRTMTHVSAKPSASARDQRGFFSYFFNVWLDFSSFSSGLHHLQLYFEQKSSGYYAEEHAVLIEEEPSDLASTSVDPGSPGERDPNGAAVYSYVNGQPSLIVPARRAFFGQVEQILVMRADQLGDFVISLPAINRLRELFPGATIVGLLGHSVVELARELGCFAEIIAIDFPYDPARRRRRLPLGEQSALRARLQEFSFDLAIDLSPAGDSRPLLRLSGARFTVGFDPSQFPWLSLGLDVHTSNVDRGTRRAPHATVPLSLVEAIAVHINHRPMIAPPAQPDHVALGAIGIEQGRYVVLHAGARHAPQRWPLAHYIDLARLILRSSELTVVVFVDSAADAELVARANLPAERCVVLAGQRAFREFDALISHCAVFVGNDSGPKHLAALRGVKVVSVHGGRVPWAEWGQQGDGLIVTRQVPCWGCSAERAEDCGQDLACLTHIRPEEVLTAVQRLLRGVSAGPCEGSKAAKPHRSLGGEN
jgi:ADP-heptose:LPS heptosyltransferase/tetratricopeptide (TPR) repeat protein